MKIFVYSKNNNSDSERLKNMIDSFHFDCEKELFHSLNNFTNQLRREINSEIIIIILTVDFTDFHEIYSIRDLLQNFRIILILPNLEEATISKGFECYPRYVSYINSDYSDVISILNKMVERGLSSNLR
ncbi:hypothetical protein ACFL6K_02670 [Candidatus Latescibacterota bacterium]